MLTQRLAEFSIETRDLPDGCLNAAGHALIDTVGVALAGSREPASEIAQRWVREMAASEQAIVWGTGIVSTAAEAAFVNGISSHALDFDDAQPSLRGHPSTTLVPTALAVGELAGANGRDVLQALVIGVEVAGVLGLAVGYGHYMRGWHNTSTIGIFGATTVAARLLGLDPERLQHAWGIAASQVAGLVSNFGTMTKPFHAGYAARAGILAASLAKHGFTANSNIFDDGGGFFASYGGEDGRPLGQSIGKLGAPWQILEPGIYVKQWPCCYCNHRPIGGLLQLLDEHDIRLAEVTGVAVGFPPGTDNALVSEDPHTGLEGKFSVEYSLAATLLDGKLTLESFTDDMVGRPPVRELMKKVTRYRVQDSKTYSGIAGYTDLAIDTTRGRFEKRIDRSPGSPAWPMTDIQVGDKFIDCAGRALGKSGAERFLKLAQRCDSLSEIRSLGRATIPAQNARS